MLKNEPRHQYHIKDHLGNLAVLFQDENEDGLIDPNSDLEVPQRHFYYPFGLEFGGMGPYGIGVVDQYKYNGKEYSEALGLGWYFYGARMHDPAVGRFTGVDPIGERFAWVTTYNYAENEPVGHVDLWGLQAASAEIAMDRDVKELTSGQITRAEYNERLMARFKGVVAGVTLAGGVSGGIMSILDRKYWFG